MTDRELMQQALEALEKACHHMQTDMAHDQIEEAYFALRERLAREEPVYHLRSFGDVTKEQLDARQEQEPVAWLRKNGFRFLGHAEPQNDSELPLYTAPDACEWRGLTKEDIAAAWEEEIIEQDGTHVEFARAIEAKLREKNA